MIKKIKLSRLKKLNLPPKENPISECFECGGECSICKCDNYIYNKKNENEL